MVNKSWKIIPRPLMEAVLSNHAQQHRVPQPLILHGPRGVGKTTLILERLFNKWNSDPHVTGYVDFAKHIRDHHPAHGQSFPWDSWSNCLPPSLPELRAQLESCLELLALKGIKLCTISSHQIFTTLNKWHGLTAALKQILSADDQSNPRMRVSTRLPSALNLWERAVLVASSRLNAEEIGGLDGVEEEGSYNRESLAALKLAKVVMRLQQKWRSNAVKHLNQTGGFSRSLANSATDWPCLLLELLSSAAEVGYFQIGGLDGVEEEGSYNRESLAALKLAKVVMRLQQKWRSNAVKHLNQTGGFSRSLANSATDWPCLLLELLSSAAEVGYFQPKLVINNIEILKNAVLVDDSSVCASMYHDSLIWRIIALGANERCLPIVLVTSDSYYSYRAYMDFGFPDIFISRETFGWTPAEAKIHLAGQFFSQSELDVIVEVLGSNPRHLFELYALKLSSSFQKEAKNTFEDIVDAYLAYLQMTVVNPAMDKALSSVQKFANDAHSGKIPKDKLCFGAPWRNLSHHGDQVACREWAKIQLVDFVHSLVNAEFGLNYLQDCSLEIFDDPCAVALIQVGLLYMQRDPSILRPISRGIQRCLVRWFVQEQMEMSFTNSLRYKWQRIARGRNYRHLL
ncbi:unnamed protein product [Cuscuta campestris]|uniref:Uncharacterized protein n=1 Tax=Cuscuta campestris TaxID=132261 RepID=A0A484M835_9ASTE|nr:unnamed protein product [Cuscuta campestris]